MFYQKGYENKGKLNLFKFYLLEIWSLSVERQIFDFLFKEIQILTPEKCLEDCF